MSVYPRIYLAIDNCFASKRWTRPNEWMSVIRDLGLEYIEASADTEADPLYCGEEYLSDWIGEVAEAGKRTGAKVANLYSGHGSYATLGLGHTDRRVRTRIIEMWIKPMLRAARRLGAGLGFYCNAFPDSVLQNPEAYASAIDQMYGQLSEIAAYAFEFGGVTVSVEQMYSPHQVPWTIAGTLELLGEVVRRSDAPLYITIDTGHQTGQARYARPSTASLEQLLHDAAAPADLHTVWLGPESAFELAKRVSSESGRIPQPVISELMCTIDRYPYLFSNPEDSDTYAWLRTLGGHSPIVHLQQVIGQSSSHLPFTRAANDKGLIDGSRVLRSLAHACGEPPDGGLPPRAGAIYLTLEIFSGAAERPREILAKLRESVVYWRHFVPRDGMRLDELIEVGR